MERDTHTATGRGAGWKGSVVAVGRVVAGRRRKVAVEEAERKGSVVGRATRAEEEKAAVVAEAVRPWSGQTID